MSRMFLSKFTALLNVFEYVGNTFEGQNAFFLIFSMSKSAALL